MHPLQTSSLFTSGLSGRSIKPTEGTCTRANCCSAPVSRRCSRANARATHEYEPVREHRASRSVAGKNGGCRLEYRQLDTEITGRYVITTGLAVAKNRHIVHFPSRIPRNVRTARTSCIGDRTNANRLRRRERVARYLAPVVCTYSCEYVYLCSRSL